MNAARRVLDQLAAVGASITTDGDRLVLKAGPVALPAALLVEVKRQKPVLLAILADDARPGADSAPGAVAANDEAEFHERAALIACGANVPRERAVAFARFEQAPPASGVTMARWRELADDCGRFLDRWAAEGARLGWRPEDVFDIREPKGAARQRATGLAVLIKGGEVVAITPDRATIRTQTGEQLVYVRAAIREAVSGWILDDPTPASASGGVTDGAPTPARRRSPASPAADGGSPRKANAAPRRAHATMCRSRRRLHDQTKPWDRGRRQSRARL